MVCIKLAGRHVARCRVADVLVIGYDIHVAMSPYDVQGVVRRVVVNDDDVARGEPIERGWQRIEQSADHGFTVVGDDHYADRPHLGGSVEVTARCGAHGVGSAVPRCADLNGFVKQRFDEKGQILDVDRPVVDRLVEVSELCIGAATGVVGQLQHQAKL